MKSFKELLLTKAQKYRVVSTIASCRDSSYSTIECNGRVLVSNTVGYYSRGKTLKVYDIYNGYARVSRFRNRWVRLTDICEVISN